MTNVSPVTRLGYGLIDIVAYTALVVGLAALFGWRPRFEFMQAYSENDQSQYWSMLLLAFVLVLAGSVAGHGLFGKSPGKAMLGVRSVNSDGSALGLSGALRRFAYILTLNMLIFLPGPLVGFTFGPGSEPVSSALLLIAFVAIPVLAVKPWHADRSPLLQPYFGVRTVYDVPPQS